MGIWCQDASSYAWAGSPRLQQKGWMSEPLDFVLLCIWEHSLLLRDRDWEMGLLGSISSSAAALLCDLEQII